jgi:transcription elongation factor GreA
MQLEKVLITQEGLERLKEELHQRENIKKRDLVETLIISKESGDERENDGFSLAFEDFKINEQRIIDLKDIIKYHQIIQPKQYEYVELGHTITLESEKGNTKIFQLVGDYEADPMNGKITIKSPIGSSLVAKGISEKIVINNSRFRIISIN